MFCFRTQLLLGFAVVFLGSCDNRSADDTDVESEYYDKMSKVEVPCDSAQSGGPLEGKKVNAPELYAAFSIEGDIDKDLYLVSDDSYLWHFDGDTWEKIVPFSDLRGNFYAVWVNDTNNVFVGGETVNRENFDHRGFISQFDGTEWKRLDLGAETRITDIKGSSAGVAYALGKKAALDGGENEPSLLYRLDEETWRKVEQWDDMYLYGLWVAPSGTVFLVGMTLPFDDGHAVVLYGDESGWSRKDFEDRRAFSDVWGTDSNDVYAVGSGILHFNGESWTQNKIDLPFEEQFHFDTIWGAGPKSLFASGGYSGCLEAFVFHGDGTNWTILDRGISGYVSDFWSGSDDTVIAAVTLHEEDKQRGILISYPK